MSFAIKRWGKTRSVRQVHRLIRSDETLSIGSIDRLGRLLEILLGRNTSNLFEVAVDGSL
jgi:hypothetical protein